MDASNFESIDEETVSLKLRSGEKSARSEFFSRKTPGKTKIEKN